MKETKFKVKNVDLDEFEEFEELKKLEQTLKDYPTHISSNSIARLYELRKKIDKLGEKRLADYLKAKEAEN